MKIAYILSTLRNTGPVNGLYNRLKYMNRDKFQPIIVTLSEEPENTLINKFHELKVPIFQLGLSRIDGFLKGPSVLKQLLSKEKPDIIHTHGLRADMLSARYLNGYKRCSTMHNYPIHDYVMKYGRFRGTIMARQQFKAIKKIEYGVACSKSIAAMFQKHGVELTPILNGVDQEQFYPITREERIALRKKLKLPLHDQIIVSVGSLIQRKDPETIIRGFLKSTVKENGILLMIGDGPLRERCQEVVNDEPSIFFTGETNDVAKYLKVADYFVSGAFSEGLPNAVLEALASGLPVCLSDINPHQEILDHNDEVGVVFTPGNPDDLAQKLDELIKLNHINMAEQALKVVNDYLNAKVMSEKYQTLYNQVYQAKKEDYNENL